jgi:hypothetical protein
MEEMDLHRRHLLLARRVGNAVGIIACFRTVCILYGTHGRQPAVRYAMMRVKEMTALELPT